MTLPPRTTETPGLAGLAGGVDVEIFFAHLATQMPGGRNIRAEEVAAAAVALLASPDAGGINGIDLQVDGGFAQI